MFSEIERSLLVGLEERDRARTEELVLRFADSERARALKAGAREVPDRPVAASSRAG